MRLRVLKTVVRLVAGLLGGVFYAEQLGLIDVTGYIEGLAGGETATPGGVQ